MVRRFGLLACLGVIGWASTAVAAPQTLYRPDPALRATTQQQLIREQMATGSKLAGLYQIIVGPSPDRPFQQINQWLGRFGMRADDLADVMTGYWASSYFAARGVPAAPNTQQMKALRTQVTATFAANANFARLDDAGRQKIADTLMLDMVVQRIMTEQFASSPQSDRDGIADWFAAQTRTRINVDMRSGTLGPRGFESAAAAGAPETSAAKATPTPAGSSAIVASFYKSQSTIMAGGGPAGSVVIFETVTLLFADGSACYDCLDSWLKDPGIAAYRQAHPKDVGTWRKSGAQYVISYPGSRDTHEFDSNRSLKPAPPGWRLKKTFKTSGTNTAGTADSYTVGSYNNFLEFNSDGRFAYTTTGNFFSQTPAVFVGGTGQRNVKTGKYSFAPYQITLLFDDGSRKTHSFLYDPRDPDYIVMDGSIYVAPK